MAHDDAFQGAACRPLMLLPEAWISAANIALTQLQLGQGDMSSLHADIICWFPSLHAEFADEHAF